MSTFKIGDRIKIKNYSKKDNGKIAFVTKRFSADLYYIRKRWSKYEMEIYGCEMELI